LASGAPHILTANSGDTYKLIFTHGDEAPQVDDKSKIHTVNDIKLKALNHTADDLEEIGKHFGFARDPCRERLMHAETKRNTTTLPAPPNFVLYWHLIPELYADDRVRCDPHRSSGERIEPLGAALS
jgi:hypothetical protein